MANSALNQLMFDCQMGRLGFPPHRLASWEPGDIQLSVMQMVPCNLAPWWLPNPKTVAICRCAQKPSTCPKIPPSKVPVLGIIGKHVLFPNPAELVPRYKYYIFRTATAGKTLGPEQLNIPPWLRGKLTPLGCQELYPGRNSRGWTVGVTFPWPGPLGTSGITPEKFRPKNPWGKGKISTPLETTGCWDTKNTIPETGKQNRNLTLPQARKKFPGISGEATKPGLAPGQNILKPGLNWPLDSRGNQMGTFCETKLCPPKKRGPVGRKFPGAFNSRSKERGGKTFRGSHTPG